MQKAEGLKWEQRESTFRTQNNKTEGFISRVLMLAACLGWLCSSPGLWPWGLRSSRGPLLVDGRSGGY